MSTNRVVLTWTDPTTRVDGSPLPPEEIERVRLVRSGSGDGTEGHGAPSIGPGQVPLGEVGGGVQTFITDPLPVGSYNFVAYADDRDGRISADSNVAWVFVSTPLPSESSPVPIADLAARLA